MDSAKRQKYFPAFATKQARMPTCTRPSTALGASLRELDDQGAHVTRRIRVPVHLRGSVPMGDNRQAVRPVCLVVQTRLAAPGSEFLNRPLMSIAVSDVVPLTQARANSSELADQAKAGARKITAKNGESYVRRSTPDGGTTTIAWNAKESTCC